MSGLSRKEDQKLSTIQRIEEAFLNNESFKNMHRVYEPRTWRQILEKSGISKGSLAKYLPILINEGYVKGEICVVNGRLTPFYKWIKEGPYVLVKQIPLPVEGVRFWVPQDPTSEVIGRWGWFRSSGKTVMGEQKSAFRGSGQYFKLIKSKKPRRPIKNT